jgi:hypothetical protein
MRFTLAGYGGLEASLTLEPGTARTVDADMLTALAEEIVVTSEAVGVETDTTPKTGAGSHQAPRFSTPRVRQDFPETLLWVPDLVTDESGQAVVPMQLADSITTWNVQAVASTMSGLMTTAGTEVVATQPFYAVLDLPPRLTSGDVVRVPVVVRSFTDHPTHPRITLSTGDGLALVDKDGPGFEELDLQPGRSGRVSLPIRAGQPPPGTRTAFATAVVIDQGDHVDQRGAAEGDAVRRSVEIVPLGEERHRVTNATFTTTAELRPGRAAPGEPPAITGSDWSELLIYPDMASHLAGAVEALLRRPIGCAEQITSAAWASLLYLELRQAGPDSMAQEAAASTGTAATAQEYLRSAVRRLQGLARPGGGFGYWHGSRTDVVLSAHVLRFLIAASEYTAVDQQQIERTATWLASRQCDDGWWDRSSRPCSSTCGPGVQARRARDTALVVRALAEAATMLRTPPEPRPGSVAITPSEATVRRITGAVQTGLDLLEPRIGASTLSSAVACTALASRLMDRPLGVETALRRLEELAARDGDEAWWSDSLPGAFGDRGTAARILSTALVVQALDSATDPELVELRRSGLQTLLWHKDAGRTWYSTSATLAALQALTATELTHGSPARAFELRADGRLLETLEVQTGSHGAHPIHSELPPGLDAETITLTRLGPSEEPALAMAQLVTHLSIPWPKLDQSRVSTPDLDLEVRFESHEGRVGEPIRCTVRVDHPTAGWWSMLLVRVGLPPGAQVDTRELEQSLGWWGDVEVEPEHLGIYLLTDAASGPRTLGFTFEPRFAGDMVSAPSVLESYYDPQTRAVLPPQRFSVSEAPSSAPRP